MDKTKIEWCESTWNPITGCKHGCEYCYARGMVRRFEGIWDGDSNCKLAYLPTDLPKEITGHKYDGLGLKYRVGNDNRGEPKLINAPYPYGFHPTLHRHRLEAGTQRWKKPRTIFVGSMTDLFGNWVPDSWIEAVFEACKATPQHRYIFLTKNPCRYNQYYSFHDNRPANFYFGASATNCNDMVSIRQTLANSLNFLSLEPIHGFIDLGKFVHGNPGHLDWVIIGAETGRRKKTMQLERAWIEEILATAKREGTPVFMKNSLAGIWGEPLIQEYPWKKAKEAAQRDGEGATDT